jgi:hypothetical protein
LLALQLQDFISLLLDFWFLTLQNSA